MRKRSRILLRDAAITAVIVVVMAGLVRGGLEIASVVRHARATAARGAATTTSTTAHKSASTTTRPPAGAAGRKVTAAATAPALGVYAGPGAASAAEAWNTTTGGKVAYALDFLPAANWTQISDPSWLVQQWSGTPFVPVLGVPMLPASGGTLAAGAAGDYDGNFTRLAQNLVSVGLGNAVLMIGWQPGGSGNPWEVTTPVQAAAYVAFWNRIHDAMASVAGAHFRFEWDAGGPGAPVSPTMTYPGNKAVDLIATDAFDVGLDYLPPGEQWSTLDNEPEGLAWVAGFAAEHHKPLALAMVGLAPESSGGAGDNAAFLSETLSWADGVHAAMVVIWDSGNWAVTGGGYPAASAALTQAIDRGRIGEPVGNSH